MMLKEAKLREIEQRVMQTVALAGVKEFEQDVMLLIFDLKEARKSLSGEVDAITSLKEDLRKKDLQNQEYKSSADLWATRWSRLKGNFEKLELQNSVLLTYIERVRKNVSSDNICDCHGRIGEPHKKDCLLIALYALDGCTCGVKFGGLDGVHLDDCPGKKIESLGAGLTDKSQEEANKLKAEVDKWVERSRVAEDKVRELTAILNKTEKPEAEGNPWAPNKDYPGKPIS